MLYYVEYSIKAFRLLKYFNPVLLLFYLRIYIFFHMDLLHTNIFDQDLADCLLNLITHLFFQIQNLLLLAFYMDDLEYTLTLNYVMFFFSFASPSKLIIYIYVAFHFSIL